jgi:toxin ParE1/3/4
VKPVVLHSEAIAELDEAIAHYELRCGGLGLDFLSETMKASFKIQQNSKLYPGYKNTEFRMCLVERFPYTMFYMELEECIWVAALAHQKRRPGYWKKRALEE